MKEEVFMTDLIDIKETTRIYYELLYAHKCNCIDELERFSKRYSLSKLTQREIHYIQLKRIETDNRIANVILKMNSLS